MRHLLVLLTSTFLLLSCGSKPEQIDVVVNPAAPGFNAAESDPEAMDIADRVMDAMGGRQAWDDTQYIEWVFFGRRKHLWDKHNHLNRYEVPKDSLIVLIDLEDASGRVQKGGVEVTDPVDKATYLKNAKEAWINDSYWLVMPFKLKDSGVTLKYVGKEETNDDRSAEVVSLTFAEVGVTPDNMYHIYVDDETNLVTQWDFYGSYMDSLPRFQSAWPDYNTYGNILLSGGVIGNNKISDIKVSNTISTAAFTSF